MVADEPGTTAWKETGIALWKREVPERIVRGFLEDALVTDERALVAGVRAPTLVIAAERDVIPVARVRWMADSIPGARFALIEGASHMAPWTAIDVFCAILREFIEKGSPSREVWRR
jgi:L-proline amide hydrolase